ncbi:MAG: hypothetical protein M0R22_00215 [Dehalococcoidia bacterium]|jgi:hypothetical protein|nr:hypothetical protein [Dehalococcoidia bacterium]
MQTRTFNIAPGAAEEIVLDRPVAMTLLMTSDDDVAWLMTTEGPLDVERAVRLDKSQCPFTSIWDGLLVIHSPSQGSRTIQVSLAIGGAA